MARGRRDTFIGLQRVTSRRPVLMSLRMESSGRPLLALEVGAGVGAVRADCAAWERALRRARAPAEPAVSAAALAERADGVSRAD